MSPRVTKEDLANSHVVDTPTCQITLRLLMLTVHRLIAVFASCRIGPLVTAVSHPVCSEIPGESHGSSHRDTYWLAAGQWTDITEVVNIDVVMLPQLARRQTHDDTVANVIAYRLDSQ